MLAPPQVTELPPPSLHVTAPRPRAVTRLVDPRGRPLAAAVLNGFLGGYNQRREAGQRLGQLEEGVLGGGGGRRKDMEVNTEIDVLKRGFRVGRGHAVQQQQPPQ